MSPESDPRFKPLIDYCYETYGQKFNLVLPVKGAVKSLIRMLAETKGQEMYVLDRLQAYWINFLNSKDKFDREQGCPLRYFAQNVNKFAMRNAGKQVERSYARFVKKSKGTGE